MLAGDKDRDGKLVRSETAGIILPHFDRLDTNQDGFLEFQELMVVAAWLNHHHQPTSNMKETANNDPDAVSPQ